MLNRTNSLYFSVSMYIIVCHRIYLGHLTRHPAEALSIAYKKYLQNASKK